ISDHLRPVIAKMCEIGIDVLEGENGVHVRAEGDLRPVDVKTLPYPGFPTDMQAQFMALLTTVKGTSVVTETVFENRFMHVEELKRMGAQIKIDARTAIIDGGHPLSGAQVKATDLRSGAALVLAGRGGGGESEGAGVDPIDRGYVQVVEKFKGFGAGNQRLAADSEKSMAGPPIGVFFWAGPHPVRVAAPVFFFFLRIFPA